MGEEASGDFLGWWPQAAGIPLQPHHKEMPIWLAENSGEAEKR